MKRGVIVRADYLARLKELAWQDRVDLTAIIDQALSQYLKNHQDK